MVCPHVREIIPSLKLVDYLYVHAEKPWYNITYISVDLAYYEIFRAKVGKGGIKSNRINSKFSGLEF